MKKSDIRKAFKEIGYKCTIRSHALIDDGVDLAFVSPCGYSNAGGNVFPYGMVEKHKKAFDLCKQFKGVILETGERIIY